MISAFSSIGLILATGGAATLFGLLVLIFSSIVSLISLGLICLHHQNNEELQFTVCHLQILSDQQSRQRPEFFKVCSSHIKTSAIIVGTVGPSNTSFEHVYQHPINAPFGTNHLASTFGMATNRYDFIKNKFLNLFFISLYKKRKLRDYNIILLMVKTRRKDLIKYFEIRN